MGSSRTLLRGSDRFSPNRQIDITLNPDFIPEHRGTIAARVPFAGDVVLFGYRFTRQTCRSEFPTFPPNDFRDFCNMWMFSGHASHITLAWQNVPDSIATDDDGTPVYRDWHDTGRLGSVFYKFVETKHGFVRRLIRHFSSLLSQRLLVLGP